MTEDTPQLYLDADVMERNLDRLATFAKENGLNFRPHVKTHKSKQIARKQMDAGAVGVTVATLDEAEVMIDAGIPSVMIAYPITKAEKIARLKTLAERAHIIVSIDTTVGADLLSGAFSEESVDVWLKVNSGLNRCGVEPGEEAVELAHYVTKLPGLNLTGIYTHAGHAYGATSEDERMAIAKQEAESVVTSAERCEEDGITIPNRSVGTTPTVFDAGVYDGVTDIRPGNAVFYDMVQVGLGVAKPEDCAVTVKATVVSKHMNRIVIDAGSKALSLEKGAHGNESVVGFGCVVEHPELTIEKLSEEHGVIPIDADTDCPLAINDTIHIIPNHACVTVNLFDSYVVSTGEIWSVDARGGSK
ncbi:alanine racemase [Alkalibacillus almallahensis]|uniref:alanine racemase n=1 Tax=Alkalibacillus almallahensis TaxID=1379154 RepID=UPI001422ED6F|nr:alanine racemase [Alkalibacillus almallahensis]NIK11418.1 D-serine deaminase-like pyridoxal phosphate-dependent protein [Alkalibacillus almallahensis]